MALSGNEGAQPPRRNVSVSKSKASTCGGWQGSVRGDGLEQSGLEVRIQRQEKEATAELPGLPTLSSRRGPRMLHTHRTTPTPPHLALQAVRPLEGQCSKAAQKNPVLYLSPAGVPALARCTAGGCGVGASARAQQQIAAAGRQAGGRPCTVQRSSRAQQQRQHCKAAHR